MVYDLPVVGDKIKPHQVTALHLVAALAFIGTGAIIFTYNYTIPMWGLAILVAGIALTCLTIFKNKWITDRDVNRTFRIAELLISASIAVLSLVQQWKFPAGIFGVLSGAILFALYWERAAGSSLLIHIDDTGIRLPVTARKRSFPWSEVEEVVLRYGILSINTEDNRLLQWDIADTNIDIELFEAYCTAQVVANKKEKVENDW